MTGLEGYLLSTFKNMDTKKVSVSLNCAAHKSIANVTGLDLGDVVQIALDHTERFHSRGGCGTCAAQVALCEATGGEHPHNG